MPDSRPNVLLVCTDHWPGPLLHCAGHPVIQTPGLDLLAAQGVRFAGAMSECPICVPARRTLMTGTAPGTHGVKNNHKAPMPDMATLADSFGAAGYHTTCIGKLHVHPLRNRIGFHEVRLDESGRLPGDEYQCALAAAGHAGEASLHGCSNNSYEVRPWHLDESLHQTNWTALETARAIKRRDPTRPAFWYCSFAKPHPPMTPPQWYLDYYLSRDIDEPVIGDWAQDQNALPRGVWDRSFPEQPYDQEQIRLARAAFYAACTHIDHQLRVVFGTLREEGLLDDTIICFISDHGDNLGNHGVWKKGNFHRWSTSIPCILAGKAIRERTGEGRIDERLCGLQDIMPTLLAACDIPIPDSVEGQDLLRDEPRDEYFGETYEWYGGMKMLCTAEHKLIWHTGGNHWQLFDRVRDPDECHDLAGDPAHADSLADLQRRLVARLDAGDRERYLRDGEPVGAEPVPRHAHGADQWHGQRGLAFPPPPA